MQLSDLQKNSPKYEDEGKMVCINKTLRKHYRISEKDCYIFFQSSLSLKKRLKSLQTNFPVFVEQKNIRLIGYSQVLLLCKLTASFTSINRMTLSDHAVD